MRAAATKLAEKLGLDADPTPDALANLARKAGSLDDGASSSLMDVLALMQATEAAVVAGRPSRISRVALERASSVVHSVLAACGADGGGELRRRATDVEAAAPLFPTDPAAQNPNEGANAG